MSKGKDAARTRLLAIERMFQTGKALTVREILRRLELEYDVVAERKSVYADIAELTMFMNIVTFQKNQNYYYQLIDMNDPQAWEGTHTDREVKKWENRD